MKRKFIVTITEMLTGRAGQALTPRSLRSFLSRATLISCAALMGSQLVLAQAPQSVAPNHTPSSTSTQGAPQAQAPGAPSAADPPDPAASDDTPAMLPHFKDTRFWLSGQMNFIFQTHPPFDAAYSGTHSPAPTTKKLLRV